MGIRVNRRGAFIDGGVYSFEDLYKAIDNSWYWRKTDKVGRACYRFRINIYVGMYQPATLKDASVSVEFNGRVFRVYEGSSIVFGVKDETGVHDGVEFRGNINQLYDYSFGRDPNDNDITPSGNLYFYASKVDIPCKWGFFNTDDVQEVQIEGCSIRGYGFISGRNSYVKDTIIYGPDEGIGLLAPRNSSVRFENVRYSGIEDGERAIYLDPYLQDSYEIRESAIDSGGDIAELGSWEGDEKGISLVDCDTGGNESVSFEDPSYGYVDIKHSVTLISSVDREVIVRNGGSVVDTFMLSNKNSIDITYKRIRGSGVTEYGDYAFTIDRDRSFALSPDRKWIIDLDILFSGNDLAVGRENAIVVAGSEFQLGVPLDVFVISDTPDFEVYLGNYAGSVMAYPSSSQRIDSFIYRVTFDIGIQGESGSEGSPWLPGSYYVKMTRAGVVHYCAIRLVGEEEECADKQDVETILTEIRSNCSGGGSGGSGSSGDDEYSRPTAKIII